MTESPDAFRSGDLQLHAGRPFTVVVGVSATSGSPTALSWAYGEARSHHGRVVAVRAWRPPRPPAAVGGKPSVVRYDVEDLHNEAAAALRTDVAEVLGENAEVECRLVIGGRRKTLVDASRDADVVVIDAPQRTDLHTSPMFARRLVYRAFCPVVIMPPGLARQPDTGLVRAGRRLGHQLAASAATAGRPGMRPPASE